VKARAPGKVVLSGAYAVLEGAPAVVTAADRYVVCDTARPAEFVTPEVKAALGDRAAPWFDASALRAAEGKLGLGSSAAILVASLGALEADARRALSEEELRAAVLPKAIVAHRTAQGGGSGVDVAASVHGGTIVAVKKDSALSTRPTALPAGFHCEVLFAGAPASTAELVAKVRAFKARAPHEYRGVLENLTLAAEDAERAFDDSSAEGVVRALRDQLRGLTELGELARVRIVTREVARLAERANEEDAVVLPAGAGGGDIAIYAGIQPPSERLLAAFDAERHVRLGLSLGARGLHVLGEGA
jgi:phosphomevalonate kinase